MKSRAYSPDWMRARHSFIASFAFCFVNILEITVVYAMQRNDRRPQALKLHTVGRWAYPLAYCAAIVFLAIGFLA